MELKPKRIKNRLIIIGIIVIIVGITTFISIKLNQSISKNSENKKVKDFILEQESEESNNVSNKKKSTNISKNEDFLMVIEIPKINLREGIYPKESEKNKVDRNITILNESDTPDVHMGNLILAGHSGTGKTAYFNKLINLNNNDIVNIYYNHSKYQYEVTKIYEINKIGKIELENNHSTSILTLITCNTKDNTKQIVIICEKK